MSSINGISTQGIFLSIFSSYPQGNGMPANSGFMDPIQGTDVSLAVAQIAIKSQGNASDIGMAKAKLVLDATRDAGAGLVKLLENLGQNIDLYA
jgi:hypothetical protein